MAITLYIARHGETEENLNHILQGHMPGHLNDNGRKQAAQLGADLQGIHFDALLCSDLKRCVDTANIVNQSLNLRMETTPLLRERDWGMLTGCNYRSMVDQDMESVETVEQLYFRAEQFLKQLAEHHDNETVLCISHGLFCRVIQGVYLGKSIREIPRMNNAEVRRLEIITPLSFNALHEESGLTAD